MSVNKVLKIIIVLGIIMFGLTFFMGALSATDESVDESISGSDYEGTYNTTKTISIQSVGILNVVMMIVIVGALIISIRFLAKV